MLQFGCLRAWASVTCRRSARGVSRKAPPEAVSTRRAMSPLGLSRSSWWIALCSLSTGSRRAPETRAASVTNLPARTRSSLLARATSFFALSAARVGARPAVPTTAETTIETSGRQATSVRPAVPSRMRVPAGKAPEARASAAAAGSARAMTPTPNSLAGATSSRQREWAASPATRSRSG